MEEVEVLPKTKRQHFNKEYMIYINRTQTMYLWIHQIFSNVKIYMFP